MVEQSVGYVGGLGFCDGGDGGDGGQRTLFAPEEM